MKKGVLLFIALAIVMLFACLSCEKSSDNGQDPVENGGEQPDIPDVVDNDPITGTVTGTYTVPTQKSVSYTHLDVYKRQALQAQQKEKVILDTDMVEVFDDGVTMMMLAKAPNIDLLGVTVVVRCV